MRFSQFWRWNSRLVPMVLAGFVASVCVFLFSARHASLRIRGTSGGPQLVSVEPLPDAPMCEWVPASVSASMRATLLSAATAAAEADVQRPIDADRSPVRVIHDQYPGYANVVVDDKANEVFLQDENTFSIQVFNRTDNTPPTAAFTEPKRVLGGLDTKLEYNCGLYVDPDNGDLYSLASDTVDTMVVFPRGAQGNVKPMRELTTPRATFDMVVDEEAQEILMTEEPNNEILVYRKTAEGREKPVRTLIGNHTQMADPHGIAIDDKTNLLFVGNKGMLHDENPPGRAVVGSGRFVAPSITTYPLKASGDTAPLHVIQGPKTQMNWTAGMYADPEHGEIYVANDADDSVLVFRETDDGDVAPTRVIKGSKTGLKNPSGVFVDNLNHEVWVSNMGNHAATAYSLTANGNVAPLRTIRSSPAGKLSAELGNPGGAAYDSKRDQILVPNCVTHTQIAAFARLASGQAVPTRVIAGQKTLLGRDAHDIRYDAVHDEIFVTNRDAEAVLAYRAGASGEEAPIRVIQGPHTQMGTTEEDRVEVDPVHNELYVPIGDAVLVFPRDGNGDVAPIRVLKGPHTRFRTAAAVAVDPTRDLMVIGGVIGTPPAPRGSGETGGGPEGGNPNAGVGGLLIYDRTADGDTPAKAVIGGPHTGIVRIQQIQVYAPKGWIVATQPGLSNEQVPHDPTWIGVWSINDSGDVPPRWKLGGPKSQMLKPRGVALDPKHKDLIVADMRLNAILTYHFPEIF